MCFSFPVTSVIASIFDFILVFGGEMNVSFSFSGPRSIEDLLPLLLEGLPLCLQVPLGLHFSPGLPGLVGTLLEGCGSG